MGCHRASPKAEWIHTSMSSPFPRHTIMCTGGFHGYSSHNVKFPLGNKYFLRPSEKMRITRSREG